jgi:ABC-type anion transport system duplicated permease subunit
MQPHVCPVPAYLPVPIAANHLTPALCAISVISWLPILYHVCHAHQSTHSVKPVQTFLSALPAIAGSIYKLQPLAFPVLQLMRNAVAVVKQHLFALVVLALLE